MHETISRYIPDSEAINPDKTVQKVEVILRALDFTRIEIVEVTGPLRGMDVINEAVGIVYDRTFRERRTGKEPQAFVILGSGEDGLGWEGRRFTDTKDEKEAWLRRMVVSARILEKTDVLR